jgi:plastocyanin
MPQSMLTVTRFAAAAEMEVKTLNKDSDGGIMVFEPTLVKLEPGGTVKFVAADK